MNSDGFIARPRGHRSSQAAKPGVRRTAAPQLDALLQAAMDNARNGLLILDAQLHVQFVTRRASELLGVRAGSAQPTLPVMRFLAASPFLDQATLSTLSALFTEDLGGRAGREVLLSLPKPGGAQVVAVDMRPAGELGWVSSFEDVTLSRRTEDWLLEHAASDPVTGLWNRQHFMLMLHDRLAMPGNRHFTLLLINLRRFRTVNETLGSNLADSLLRLAGGRLSGMFRDCDLVARFAGHEFAVMVEDIDDEQAIAALGARLADILSQPYQVEGNMVSVGVNIGVARGTVDGDTPESLLANAGLALAAACSGAEGGLRQFDLRLDEQARLRRGMEADLRAALAQGEFELHYQPQVDMRRNCIAGFEALIRWRSPSRGMVPPNHFIGMAEEIGLIGAIGEWVLNEACREATTWPEDISVAVNASPLQVEAAGFDRAVSRALERSGLAATRLDVEVTENLLRSSTDIVHDTLASLRGMGVRLVLDDFGTGYASLSQLSKFRFDKIKIDRSFVSSPDAATEHTAIVKAIAALGTSLGIPTTAEGVETVVQLDQIRADGCTCVQGYYYSKPVPASAVPALIRALHHRQPEVEHV